MSNRPVLVEKQSYNTTLPVEHFIVQLLKSQIESTLEALPAQAGYKVLDLGCGGQPFRYLFEKKFHTYVSADAQNPLGIVDHVIEIDKELPEAMLQSGPFDFILCTEVMEHIADWEMAFKNFSRMLNPGGRILITCPFFYILHEQPYDFWRATPYVLKHYAQRHNLKEIRMEMLGDTWDVLGTVLGASYNDVYVIKGGFTAKIVRKVFESLLRSFFKILKNGWLQSLISLDNKYHPIYLSNFALLEKSP